MKSLREHEKILPPAEIERRSFEIIEQELPHTLDPLQAPVIKRVIHTTADFSSVLFTGRDRERQTGHQGRQQYYHGYQYGEGWHQWRKTLRLRREGALLYGG